MNFRKILFFPSLILFVTVLLMVSCKEEAVPVDPSKNLVSNYSNEPSLRWNAMFLEIERYAYGYRPTPTARALGLMGLAAYESCVSGMPLYNSLETHFDGLIIPNIDPTQEYHWPTVVHAVYTTMMPKFFDQSDPTQSYPPSVIARWNSLVTELNDKYLTEAGTEVFNRSKAYGEAVGNAVWEWSTTDAYGHLVYQNPFGNTITNETYNWEDHYNGPGNYKPTAPPGPTQPLDPFFGKARAFALLDQDKLCLPPSAYFMEYNESPTSEYYSQALQVYTKNAHTDYTTEWIGEFWSDDLLNLTFSPSARWIAICNQVIEAQRSNLETSLEAYAKVGMALNDAAVGAWYSKYYYNIERPQTYIWKIIDPDYKSNLDNPLTGDVGFVPPFPGYPSGHATYAGAGAEALASVFGYNYSMTDRCHLGRTEFEGTPRTFSSFLAMAQEDAWSRVLLGVHFRMDCDEGVRFGTSIGRKICQLPWKK